MLLSLLLAGLAGRGRRYRLIRGMHGRLHPHPKGQQLLPDFIALDTKGTYWVIEREADESPKEDGVLRKKDAAERWSRAVRDDGEYGILRYVFATEADIKQAAGSWTALLVTTKSE